jgi:hypothetical protein
MQILAGLFSEDFKLEWFLSLGFRADQHLLPMDDNLQQRPEKR